MLEPVMPRLLVAFLVMALAPGVALPAAEALRAEAVVAGPWLMAEPAGGWRVGLLLMPPLSPAEAAAIPVTDADGRPVTLAPVRLAPVDRGGVERQTPFLAAVWSLPAGTPDRLRIGGRPVTLPPRPAADRPVRLAVAGARAYPTKADLERLAKGLGGPVEGVILVGRGLERRLGLGDWEQDLPIIVAPPDVPSPGLTALLGGREVAWRGGLVWGPLGLTRLQADEEPALTIGRLECPWRLLLDAEDRWDLGLLSQPEVRQPVRLRPLLAQTSRSQVPLILAGGSPSGFLSEPLGTNAKGALMAKAGGTRYLAAAATGEGCVGLPPEVALPLDRPTAVGLSVTPRFLTLVLQELEGDVKPLKLTWVDASDDGIPQAGPGWGFGDGHALQEAWKAERTAATPDPLRLEALALELAQIPRSELAKGEWEVSELLRLCMPEGEQPVGTATRALARRLVADVDFIGDEPALLGRLPGWLRRDALLRWAVHPGEERRWVALAARSRDPMIVRAILSQVERSPDSELLAVLVDRLAAQAAKELPLDADPLIQARLTSAVFGSAVLSPTPLRTIARDLRERLEPVARLPVERFLTAKGRFRDPDAEAAAAAGH